MCFFQLFLSQEVCPRVGLLGHMAVLLQEGRPLPGPETGLLSNTQKRIVRGDTCADKARDFIGKGHPGGEQRGKGTQESCSAAWLAMSGFMVGRPFPNSSGWWRLISSVFLIRISCHKTTHANGYYGAWPGWAVSVSVLPLTTAPCKMGYSGALGSGSLGFFGFFPTRVANT